MSEIEALHSIIEIIPTSIIVKYINSHLDTKSNKQLIPL